MENKDIYTFGNCRICKQGNSLKNGYCHKCESLAFLTQLFEEGTNEQ